MKNAREDDFIIRWQSQVKKGLLEYVILLVLKRKTCYGYELIQDIKHYTNLELAEGTIYPLLNRLKGEGALEAKWVEMEIGIPRKYYSITAKGKRLVEQMGDFWSGLNHRVAKLEAGK